MTQPCHLPISLNALLPEPEPWLRAVVIIPARNEEDSLPQALEALRLQCTGRGEPLDASSYEVIVLLNNCTDGSFAVTEAFRQRHPWLRLHVVVITLEAAVAHVGTARRLLMDAAMERLLAVGRPRGAILSTDADSIVATDWIYENLRAIRAGADAVGGVIHLKPHDFDLMSATARYAFGQDLIYQTEVAHLESLLDPDPADPWPRHLHHFGASLACTAATYHRVGGLPAVRHLEDVAFVDVLRRTGARLRHATGVHIFTSARLHGRAEVGLSGQLRQWDCGVGLQVESADYLTHRFNTLRKLRHLWNRESFPTLRNLPQAWRGLTRDAFGSRLPQSAFLEGIDCNALVEETFTGRREGAVENVIADLRRIVRDYGAGTGAPARTREGAADDLPMLAS